MGVIKRQGVKSSIVNYIGVVLGFIGTLFIYPLDKNTYGQLQTWIANATLLIPFLTLGSNTLITKFHSIFKKEYGHGFGTFILKITIRSLLIGLLAILLITLIHKNIPLHFQLEFLKVENVKISITLAIIVLFNLIFKSFSAINLRIVIPEIVHNLGFKLFIFAIIAYGFFFDSSEKINLLALYTFYLFALIFLIFYSIRLDKNLFKEFRLKTIDKPFSKQINSFWLFTGLNIFGTMLIYQIDVVMIAEYLNKESVTNYLAFLMMSNIISIPSRSFLGITAPIISDEMANKNYHIVKDHYLQLSKNLLIFGVFCFGILWINMDEILTIMSNGETYEPFKWCFVFLGLAKLFELSTSINHQIIVYSKWYKINLVLLFITATSNIVTNYILIQKYGIIGIAIGSSITILIYNLLKTIIVYKLIKCQPFQWKMIPAISILIIIIFAPNVTVTEYFLISGLVKSLCFLITFISIIWLSKSSQVFNNLVISYYHKIVKSLTKRH
ncbi:MAG: lipopolysaccharide biosynthesis protein [Flavobacteriales bacterium]